VQVPRVRRRPHKMSNNAGAWPAVRNARYAQQWQVHRMLRGKCEVKSQRSVKGTDTLTLRHKMASGSQVMPRVLGKILYV